MDYEKKYNEALERAKKFEEKYGGGYAEYIFPELAESEDEKIRRKMIEHFKAKTKETWCNMPVKDIIAYLEKQKEPENTSASTMAPSCWAEEPSLQKEQKPNYCHYGGDPSVERCKYCSAACSARLTKEQKPKAKAKSPLSPHELYDAKIEGISQGRQDVLDHPEQFGLQKPAEWSEEDELMQTTVIQTLERFGGCGTTGMQIDWLKSLPERFSYQTK